MNILHLSSGWRKSTILGICVSVVLLLLAVYIFRWEIAVRFSRSLSKHPSGKVVAVYDNKIKSRELMIKGRIISINYASKKMTISGDEGMESVLWSQKTILLLFSKSLNDSDKTLFNSRARGRSIISTMDNGGSMNVGDNVVVNVDRVGRQWIANIVAKVE